ncbi:MAG: DUF1540 domain-containing protein [Christensenellales bacterium]
MNHPNPGIRCQVNTCYYYMDGNHCCADQIEVQPKNAMNNEETDCGTFMKK